MVGFSCVRFSFWADYSLFSIRPFSHVFFSSAQASGNVRVFLVAVAKNTFKNQFGIFIVMGKMIAENGRSKPIQIKSQQLNNNSFRKTEKDEKNAMIFSLFHPSALETVTKLPQFIVTAWKTKNTLEPCCKRLLLSMLHNGRAKSRYDTLFSSNHHRVNRCVNNF